MDIPITAGGDEDPTLHRHAPPANVIDATRPTAAGLPGPASYFTDHFYADDDRPVLEIPIVRGLPVHVLDEDNLTPDQLDQLDEALDAHVEQQRGEADLPKWQQQRYYDRETAQLWLYYTFRANGGRFGMATNPIGYKRLGKLFCDHYGIPYPENQNSFVQFIRRWTLRGRDHALYSKNLVYEERLAERRADFEEILNIGYTMRNAAMNAINHRGEAAIDFKLLEKGAKIMYLGADRLAILDGLDAPQKMAIKQETTTINGGNAPGVEDNSSLDRIASVLERAEARAVAERNRLTTLPTESAPAALEAFEDAELVDE